MPEYALFSLVALFLLMELEVASVHQLPDVRTWLRHAVAVAAGEVVRAADKTGE